MEEPWIPCSIESIKQVGERYCILKLRPSKDYKYQAGQYIRLLFSLANGSQANYYSIAGASNGDGLFELCLICEHESQYGELVKLHDAKANVFVSSPQGNFGGLIDRHGCQLLSEASRVVMVAGGSGIAPIRAITQRVLKEFPDKQLLLLYGCQDAHCIPYHAEIVQWMKTLPNYQAILTADAGTFEQVSRGHVVSEIHQILPIAAEDLFLLCGPPVMMHYVRQWLDNHGVDEGRIFFER